MEWEADRPESQGSAFCMSHTGSLTRTRRAVQSKKEAVGLTSSVNTRYLQLRYEAISSGSVPRPHSRRTALEITAGGSFILRALWEFRQKSSTKTARGERKKRDEGWPLHSENKGPEERRPLKWKRPMVPYPGPETLNALHKAAAIRFRGRGGERKGGSLARPGSCVARINCLHQALPRQKGTPARARAARASWTL